MSIREFIKWIAFFKIEQEDAEKQRQAMQDKQDAQRALRSLAGRGF